MDNVCILWLDSKQSIQKHNTRTVWSPPLLFTDRSIRYALMNRGYYMRRLRRFRLKTFLRTFTHARSVIRFVPGRILASQDCKLSSCGRQRLWSDCAHAQADLSLCWAHMSQGSFSHARMRKRIWVFVGRSFFRVLAQTDRGFHCWHTPGRKPQTHLICIQIIGCILYDGSVLCSSCHIVVNLYSHLLYKCNII